MLITKGPYKLRKTNHGKYFQFAMGIPDDFVKKTEWDEEKEKTIYITLNSDEKEITLKKIEEMEEE